MTGKEKGKKKSRWQTFKQKIRIRRKEKKAKEEKEATLPTFRDKELQLKAVQKGHFEETWTGDCALFSHQQNMPFWARTRATETEQGGQENQDISNFIDDLLCEATEDVQVELNDKNKQDLPLWSNTRANETGEDSQENQDISNFIDDLLGETAEDVQTELRENKVLVPKTYHIADMESVDGDASVDECINMIIDDNSDDLEPRYSETAINEPKLEGETDIDYCDNALRAKSQDKIAPRYSDTAISVPTVEGNTDIEYVMNTLLEKIQDELEPRYSETESSVDQAPKLEDKETPKSTKNSSSSSSGCCFGRPFRAIRNFFRRQFNRRNRDEETLTQATKKCEEEQDPYSDEVFEILTLHPDDVVLPKLEDIEAGDTECGNEECDTTNAGETEVTDKHAREQAKKMVDDVYNDGDAFNALVDIAMACGF